MKGDDYETRIKDAESISECWTAFLNLPWKTKQERYIEALLLIQAGLNNDRAYKPELWLPLLDAQLCGHFADPFENATKAQKYLTEVLYV